MDPFRLSLALGPLSLYLILLGLINLGRRAFVNTGARDTAALGVALCGLMVVGPIELFLPRSAADRFGVYVWTLAISLYVLCVVFLVLVQRPRLVVYNISLDELRAVLTRVVASLDPEAQWASRSVVLPRLGIELYVQSFGPMRNISLVAVDSRQDLAGWARLETTLGEALAEQEVARNPRGVTLLLVGGMMMVGIYWQLAAHPELVMRSLEEMLGL